ncbi:hypothetical protein DID88_003088 [Monilinia fructigena]|uniref:Uncharacterized protein n=1 Tax=Monilinia fructigena TaxID=38457 RepID=A0A395IUB2_9HELO|nr:hypothetical protein DID88_003088 [Monilinia fructigena]
MTDLNKANCLPLLKGSIDILLILPQYLESIEDFIHLSSSCRTLRDLYSENAPSSGLLFDLAAFSSLKVFDPMPYLLIAGVARQVGNWAIETPENRVEFHNSFKTKGINGLFELCKKRGQLSLKEIDNLVHFRESVIDPLTIVLARNYRTCTNNPLRPATDPMIPPLQIAMFGDLFASSVRNFCAPGAVVPLSTKIRLDWLAKCCPDLLCKESLTAMYSINYQLQLRAPAEYFQMTDILTCRNHTPTFLREKVTNCCPVLKVTYCLQRVTLTNWMREKPQYFGISTAEHKSLAYDAMYHERNHVFNSLLSLQGLRTLELIYHTVAGRSTPNTRATIDAAMIAFRMDESQVSMYNVVHGAMLGGRCRSLGTVVDIEHDMRFICNNRLRYRVVPR